MKTPIIDFVENYINQKTVRFHMPGHKGKSFLGFEERDVTEIFGADVLYSADGIIAESESYASSLFGTAHSFYSTEGSTLAIKAMLALAVGASSGGVRKTVLASRGSHKAFLHAAALLDFDIEWIYPEGAEHLCSAAVGVEDVRPLIDGAAKPSAVYLTSPDYLGNISDVGGVARLCRERGIPLLVDNAHGAYLNFLTPSRHPIALGADMCCDSAHKTLPVLTGGAYLHISRGASSEYTERARGAMALFASTSPSYLILESLDLCNKYLAEGYRERLDATVRKIDSVKRALLDMNIAVEDKEPLKIVICARKIGHTGTDLSSLLRKRGIEIEFADTEYAVIMATPENSDGDYERLISAMSELEIKAPLPLLGRISAARRAMTVREATFAERELIPVRDSVGRICASSAVSCPPAVPIAVSGEIITEEAVSLFLKYEINEIEVVKND